MADTIMNTTVVTAYTGSGKKEGEKPRILGKRQRPGEGQQERLGERDMEGGRLLVTKKRKEVGEKSQKQREERGKRRKG